MNKLIKKSWIAILALASAVVGACSPSKNINKEDTSNGNKTGLSKQNDENGRVDMDVSRNELKKKIKELKATLEEREMSCVYGSPEVISSYQCETSMMRKELDSLQKLYDNGYGLSVKKQKAIIEKRIKEINTILKERETSGVYGSPEMIEKYSAETRKLRKEQTDLQKRIDEMNGVATKDDKTPE